MDNDDERLEALILKYFIIGSLLFTGCGVEKDQPTTISGPKSSWAEIKPIVDRECARCHNGVKHPLTLSTESSFKSSKAKVRIENGSMPPDRTLPAADKKSLLSYF